MTTIGLHDWKLHSTRLVEPEDGSLPFVVMKIAADNSTELTLFINNQKQLNGLKKAVKQAELQLKESLGESV